MKEGLFSVLNFTSQVPAQSLTLPQSLTFASKTGRRLRVGTLIDANYGRKGHHSTQDERLGTSQTQSQKFSSGKTIRSILDYFKFVFAVSYFANV